MIISGIVQSSLARANFRWEAERIYFYRKRGAPRLLLLLLLLFLELLLENANRKRKNDGGESGIKRRGGQRNELELYEYEIRGGGWLVPKPNLRQRSVLLNVLLSTNVLCKYPVGIFFPPLRKSEDVSTIDIIICTSCTRSGLFSFLRAIIRSWSAILPSPWSYSFSSSSFFSAAL